MSIIREFSDFSGETEHFSGKNGALRWSILVGKQKHNVQKPTNNLLYYLLLSCKTTAQKCTTKVRKIVFFVFGN